MLWIRTNFDQMRCSYCQCIWEQVRHPSHLSNDSTIRYYQSKLGNRLCYKIMSNDYDRVIISSGLPAKPDTKYKIMVCPLSKRLLSSQISQGVSGWNTKHGFALQQSSQGQTDSSSGHLRHGNFLKGTEINNASV